MFFGALKSSLYGSIELVKERNKRLAIGSRDWRHQRHTALSRHGERVASKNYTPATHLSNLPYQLSMVGSAPTMVVTGNQSSISEKKPEKWSTTSKEGSRHTNYTLPARGVESVSHTVGLPLAVFNWRDVERLTGLSLARGGPTNIPTNVSLLSIESGRGSKAIKYRPSSNHKRCQLVIRRSSSDDSVGSFWEIKAFGFRGKYNMIAKLKLKGIDGKAPPEVEPAA
ncbi:hypothetical protein G5I_04203 [Acromyrmex echinatior]|uniref:Uncharacterized protein n=1 Tax=Acromyrmex echinatior TaxID=103372 RepID=F4WEZ7_ACREC|nr:hypothetical protein G5I_04203 [Acromyrmex echinatior]